MHASLRTSLLLIAGLSSACSDRIALDKQALEDPATCAACHADHYREWAGSMHAYATDDPVFAAMNQLGQRETQGALGDFCIRCHAPMATSRGLTRDGLNLEQIPRKYKGVTCYFCHQVDSVFSTHNAGLKLAEDTQFRAALPNPVYTQAHESGYSPLHDSSKLESSELCGSCHDVATPGGVLVERTSTEWKASVFAKDAPGALSCSGCHMPGQDGPAAIAPHAPKRRNHDHSMPGVDVSLTPGWPEAESQLNLVQRDLKNSVRTILCVRRVTQFEAEVTLDNVLVGHAWPSGVTHARRAWVEVIGWYEGQEVFASGKVAEGQAVTQDPSQPWILRTHFFDADNKPTDHAWAVASFKSNLLQPSVTNDPSDPRFYHAQKNVYTFKQPYPDRIRMRVLMQPVGVELLEDLIRSGDLDPAVRARMPTLVLEGATKEWTLDKGYRCVQ